MGKIITESSKEATTTTTHFSHSHPLNLCIYIPQQTPNISSSCLGCSLPPVGFIYSCTVCSCFLHKRCFETPQPASTTTTTHFSHSHPLNLCIYIPQQTPNISSSCLGCSLPPFGFIYSCTVCSCFLHKRCFETPQPASTPQPPQWSGQQYTTQPNLFQPAGNTNPFMLNNQRNALLLQYLQQSIQNSNAMTQAMLAGGVGGLGVGGGAGTFGGDNGYQQLMQLHSGGQQEYLQALMNGGAGGGYGTGGFVGDNGYQQLMQLYSGLNSGGAGGQQEYLQAMINAGGGGGMNLIQSLLGGGSGLDFLGGMLGGFGC